MLSSLELRGRAVIAPAVTVVAIVAAVSGFTPEAAAGPPDTVWIEDMHLHPSGPAELAFAYEYQADPSDADSGGAGDGHLLTIRTAAGYDRVPIDLRPSLGLSQLGDAGAAIDHVGLRVRYRLAGTTSFPKIAVALAYQVSPGSGLVHELDQAAIVRWQRGKLIVVGEVGLREQLGGDIDTRVELRAGAAVTGEFAIGFIRLGLEAFTLVPLAGPRISDYALAADGEDVSLYVGPSTRLDFESMWLSAGLITGKLLDAGSPVMVRAVLGTQF